MAPPNRPAAAVTEGTVVYVQWAPIFAGAVVAAALSFVLHAFAAGIGLSISSTAPTWRDASIALVILSGLYLILVALAAYVPEAMWPDGCVPGSHPPRVQTKSSFATARMAFSPGRWLPFSPLCSHWVRPNFAACDRTHPVPAGQAGLNYTVRLYQTRAEILNGQWKFPEPQPVMQPVN